MVLRNNKNPTTKKPATATGGTLIHKRGGAIKASNQDGWVEGYLVAWGNPSDTDLQGEHFTPRTEFCLDWFKERPVLYHHGLEDQTGLRKIGVIKAIEADDYGLWVQAQLDLRDRYAAAVYDMVQKSDFGWSSGSVDHLVKIAENGEIATWPIIEGSITPTPAQPAKTTVRPLKSHAIISNNSIQNAPTVSYKAFKAIVGEDQSFSDYLKELYAKVETDYYPPRHNTTKSFNRIGKEKINQRLKSRFGLRATRSDIERTAADLEPVFTYEDDDATSEYDEMDATLSALETEMIVEEKVMPYNRRSRSVSRRPVRRLGGAYRRARRGYRSDDPTVLEDVAFETETEFAAQTEDIAAEMADEIAAEMESELAAEVEQAQLAERAKRAIIRKAMRRAVRQLEEPTLTDDTVLTDEFAVESDEPIASMRRARRGLARRGAARRGVGRRGVGRHGVRRGFRTELEPTLTDEFAVESDGVSGSENAVLMEEIAAQARRSGYRKGLRQAFRMLEDTGESTLNDGLAEGEIAPVASVDETAKRIRRLARRGAARRGVGRRGVRRGFRTELEPTLTDEFAVESDDELSVASALRRLRRMKQDDLGATLEDELAVTSDPEVVRRVRRNSYRNAIRRARRGFRTDEPTLTDEFAVETDEPAVLRARRRAMRRGYRNDDPMLSDSGFAVESDDLIPALSDEPTIASRSYRRRAKSNDVEYWRNRAMKAETMEAPNQRSFNRMAVKDVADRAGSYENAFKTYLYRGISALSPTEQYVLNGKGRTNWGATKSFERTGNGYKTITSGVDSSAGFAVPPDWVNELNKNIMTQTVMAPECRTRTTTSDRIVQPNLVTSDARRAHAAQVRWPGETISSASEHSTTEDTLSQIEVPIHVMLMSMTATNSSLEDVTYNLESEINEAFSEAVAIAYDELIWAGDGQGKMEGIVTNSLISGHRSTDRTVVSGYVPTGSADGFASADAFKEMLLHLPRGYRARSKWFMNSDSALQLATLKDGNGNYLIDHRDEGLQTVGVPEKLLGLPIVINEWADEPTSGEFPVILGDLSRGYIIGKRVDFSIRRFDDSKQAELDQVLFLGRARIGGQVLTPAAVKVLKVATS